MKKFLVGSILTLITSVAIANQAPSPYVGAGVGITANSGNLKFRHLNSNTVGAYRGVPFTAFAGFGGTVSDNFYLAAEAEGTVGTANISNNKDFKTSYGYGASVIPGIMVNDRTLAYGRAGIVRSKFPEANNSFRNGGKFGVGLQTSLTSCVDLRGEYDFEAYNSFKDKTWDLKLSPRADQFNVGFVYKFQ